MNCYIAVYMCIYIYADCFEPNTIIYCFQQANFLIDYLLDFSLSIYFNEINVISYYHLVYVIVTFHSLCVQCKRKLFILCHVHVRRCRKLIQYYRCAYTHASVIDDLARDIILILLDRSFFHCRLLLFTSDYIITWGYPKINVFFIIFLLFLEKNIGHLNRCFIF